MMAGLKYEMEWLQHTWNTCSDKKPDSMYTTFEPRIKNIVLPKTTTDYYRKSFAFTGAKLWNALPKNLKEERSLEVFFSIET